MQFRHTLTNSLVPASDSPFLRGNESVSAGRGRGREELLDCNKRKTRARSLSMRRTGVVSDNNSGMTRDTNWMMLDRIRHLVGPLSPPLLYFAKKIPFRVYFYNLDITLATPCIRSRWAMEHLIDSRAQMIKSAERKRSGLFIMVFCAAMTELRPPVRSLSCPSSSYYLWNSK